MDKTIIIGADRLAVPLKDALKHRLEEVHGYQVTDVGMQEGGALFPILTRRVRLPVKSSRGTLTEGSSCVALGLE